MPTVKSIPSPSSATPEAMDHITDSMLKAYNEMGAMANDGMNAAMETANVLTTGCNEMFQSMATLIQNSLTQTTEAGRAMLNARTMRDLVDTQNSLIKEGFEAAIGEASKITQLSVRIAQQISEPMNNHMQATMCKITKTKAA